MAEQINPSAFKPSIGSFHADVVSGLITVVRPNHNKKLSNFA
jgi:hypothetical protein